MHSPNTKAFTSQRWLAHKPMIRTWLSFNMYSSPLQFQDIPVPASTTNITYDLSTGTPRPFVPQTFRRCVFNSLHSSHILELRPQNVSLQPGMFGPTLKPTFKDGPKHVFSASVPRYRDTQLSHFQHSSHETPVLIWCTLTSLSHTHRQKVTHTCLRASTGSLGGQRHTL